MLVQDGGHSQKDKQESKEGYVVCHLGKLYHAKICVCWYYEIL